MLLACNSYITLRISNLIGQGLPCHGSRCRFESDLIRVLGYIVQIIALIGIFHNLNMYYTINIQEKLLQVGRNICYILCINTWVFDSPLFRSRTLCLPFCCLLLRSTKSGRSACHSSQVGYKYIFYQILFWVVVYLFFNLLIHCIGGVLYF